MNNLKNEIENAFLGSFDEFNEKVHTLANDLSEEQFWTRVYGYGNSFGHLVLHITGNLNHFIGVHVAGTGYVRDRDREFNEAGKPPKAEVLKQLDDAVAMVKKTLAAQQLDDWSKPYEIGDKPDFVKSRFGLFLRCTTHFHHHLGQMIYLQKEFSK
jgi:hypothetical protein